MACGKGKKKRRGLKRTMVIPNPKPGAVPMAVKRMKQMSERQR